MNRCRFLGLLLIGCSLFLAYPVFADSPPDWPSAKTRVFVVGLLEWQNSSYLAPFPDAKADRRDEQLVRFFKTSGVSRNRVVYLQDASATKARIVAEFEKLLDRTQSEDLLVFYFCGHGTRDRQSGESWFAAYDADENRVNAWNVREVFKTIEKRFQGQQILMLADCCYSGALYDEARRHDKSRIAYAVLTSSSSHDSSTAEWTFSDSLLAGLRGDATVDLDGDHAVTLAEVAEYTELEMAFVKGQKAMFFAAEGFPSSTTVSRATARSKPHVGERIEVEYKGHWYKAKTIDTDGRQRKVRYVNFDSSWDEWVGPERRRPYKPSQFEEGTKVHVRWKDDNWYPASVRETYYGLHLVRYDGYNESADEWIKPDAIRLRK